MSRKLLGAAALVGAALIGTEATAQVFDLRSSPYVTEYPTSQQRLTRAEFQQFQARFRTVDHQAVTAGLPDLGGFPATGGPIGHPGAFPAPQVPGGFPALGGLQPAGPAFGGACAPGASPVIGAVDALIAQVGAFLQVFGPTAHCVPEGDCIYREALELYQTAIAFRQAALAGAPPCDLQALHAAMDATCCRLVTRVNRIACGRTGPNIEQVRLIGLLCNQIRALI